MSQNGWGNEYTNFGSDAASYTTFSATGKLSDSTLENLYTYDDIAKKIVELIVLDALRYEPTFNILKYDSNVNDSTSKIDINANTVPAALIKNYNVIESAADAAIAGRLYGWAAVYVDVADGKDPSEELMLPIKPDSLIGFDVLDKPSVMPNLSIHVGEEPESYRFVDWRSTKQLLTIHKSRLIIFGGARTFKRQYINNNYCDFSVLQTVYDTLKSFENVLYSANTLVNNASQPIVKISGLNKMMATNKAAFQARMKYINFSRHASKMIMLEAGGADGIAAEDFTQVGAENLEGSAAILDYNFKRLASAAGMPHTILFGDSPSGLNATGESDTRNWFNKVESFQRDYLENKLNAMVTLIAQSEQMLTQDETIGCEFKSLWETTPSEDVDILNKKLDAAIKMRDLNFTEEEIRKMLKLS
jgi:phage-related protein (TIGR01555 family)